MSDFGRFDACWSPLLASESAFNNPRLTNSSRDFLTDKRRSSSTRQYNTGQPISKTHIMTIIQRRSDRRSYGTWYYMALRPKSDLSTGTTMTACIALSLHDITAAQALRLTHDAIKTHAE
mgnify:CR=1 FL=1